MSEVCQYDRPTRIKLTLHFLTLHNMKTYGLMEVYLHALLSSPLEGGRLREIIQMSFG
jgi:hypothetical protein